VIGINSQIYSRTGGFMGLSFAVPIDIAMQVAKQLKASGHVQRGWIGVTIQDVTRELAESFGMKRPSGALIADVLPDGPAAKSDLRVGDVVVEYENHRVDLSADLPPLVGQTAPGTRAKLGVIRNGQTKTLSITIAELPEETAETRPESPPGPERPGVLGMQLKDLTPAQRKQLGVSQGVLVEKVAEGPALKAGVRPGDVILQVQGRPMRSPPSCAIWRHNCHATNRCRCWCGAGPRPCSWHCAYRNKPVQAPLKPVMIGLFNPQLSA